MDKVRKLILDRIASKGTDLKAVSKAIGRNETYMQQFIRKGSPKELPERVRRDLASLLGIDEAEIGGTHSKHRGIPPSSGSDSDMVYVPVHDVQAAAGVGRVVDQESEIGRWPFPKTYIRESLAVSSTSLAIIEVIGDSMEPTLRSGDRIMIDLNDKNFAVGGIFALNDGDQLVVKRIEKIPNSHPPQLVLISDNPIHGRYPVPAMDVSVAGRAIWVGRRL